MIKPEMDYRQLLQRSALPDGTVTKTNRIAAGPISLRQRYIKNSPKSVEAVISAAIEIQRVYRGYCCRCRLMSILDPTQSKTALYGESKHNLTRLRDVRTPSPKYRTKSGSSISSGRTRLERYYNTYVNRMIEAGSAPGSKQIMSFKVFCANYIQNWWHQVKSKRSSALRRGGSRKKKRTGPPTQPEAAIIIQRAWRKHIDIQVYKYYRDLINFKQKGDPAMMLKCINPSEASFLDAAAGIHIKFRLAGERFPPNIYYKIYTHRPIQDLCANSPKDYTNAHTKRLMCRDVHNKGDRVPQLGQAGWYQRSENNGWRLVSDRMLHHIMSDSVTWETSKKKIEFHHNRLQRRADVERKKKQKKIEWMRKMYKDGILRAKVEDRETVNLIEGAAAGMVATVDAHGPEAVQDWEVDELLDWTTGLNFDDYWTGWKEIATSSNSENLVGGGALYVADSDPYDISVSQGVDLSRQKSNTTQASHNTPISSQSPISSY